MLVNIPHIARAFLWRQLKTAERNGSAGMSAWIIVEDRRRAGINEFSPSLRSESQKDDRTLSLVSTNRRMKWYYSEANRR